MNLLVVVGLAAASAAPFAGPFETAGDDRPEARRPEAVWNGVEVPSGEHPAVVALAARTADGLFVFCSGTLVAPEAVLTAAHCLQGERDLVVLFGGDLVHDGVADAIEARASHPHPRYALGGFVDDIGVVLLDRAPSGVRPVVLSAAPLKPEDHGADVLLVGFGFDPPNGGAGVKREALVSIVGHDAQHVLTESPDANLCQGDSGGPGFRAVGGRWVQIGVNAFVTPDCIDGTGGLTRVDAFLPWVRTIVPEVQVQGESPDRDDRIPRDTGLHGPAPEAAGCDSSSAAAGAALALGALLTLRRRRRADEA